MEVQNLVNIWPLQTSTESLMSKMQRNSQKLSSSTSKAEPSQIVLIRPRVNVYISQAWNLLALAFFTWLNHIVVRQCTGMKVTASQNDRKNMKTCFRISIPDQVKNQNLYHPSEYINFIFCQCICLKSILIYCTWKYIKWTATTSKYRFPLSSFSI